jgi:hypothetical protein
MPFREATGPCFAVESLGQPEYEKAMLHGHSKADLRNWHLHRVALEKLQQHPELLSSVLGLLDGWLGDDNLRCSRPWLEQWREMRTAWPFEKMRATLLDAERGQTLRQCSPLGLVLTAQERWQALREASRSASAETIPAPA